MDVEEVFLFFGDFWGELRLRECWFIFGCHCFVGVFFNRQFSVSGSGPTSIIRVERALLCSRECVGITEGCASMRSARYGILYCSF